jgi:hypothetical protein
MNLHKFGLALTVLVLTVCLLTLSHIPLKPAIAQGQPVAIGIHIPVIINLYPNSGTSEEQARNAVEEANKLLNQANIKLHVVHVNDPTAIAAANGGGDDGNGKFNQSEREKIRTFGGDELKKMKNQKGIKLSFGKVPMEENPNAVGVSLAAGGYPPECNGKPGNPTIILKYTDDADTGNTIAHELGHVLGITGDYNDPNRIMDSQGRGNKFSDGEIKEMRKVTNWGEFGKCSVQWEYNMYPATKLKAQFGATTDDGGDQGNPVSAIYDLHQIYLTSTLDFTDIYAEITVAELLPTTGEINAIYSLGFNIDANIGTGVAYAGYDGIDRIVYVYVAGDMSLGTFTVIGEVKNTITDITVPLPVNPETATAYEIVDFEGLSDPTATGFYLIIPKELLSLSAVEAPVVATTGENVLIYDTAGFVFDSERWLKDPTFTTFGNGVPTPGQNYLFQISGLEPNSPFNLYVDDRLILSSVLDPAGGFSGSFVFPSDMPNTEIHFLTAQDSTGEFAYSITCPKITQTPVGGYSVLIDITVGQFDLLASYIGFASTIVVATVATSVYVKCVKCRKEKQ